MNCPNCQYALTAFDKSCPRCAQMNKVQSASTVATALRPAPVQAQPNPYQPPQQELPQSDACTSCGNPAIQKVSGLHRGGVWSAEAVGVGVGYGRTSSGQSFSTISTSHATSAGGTGLAYALAPPMKPHSFQPPAEILCLTGIAVASLAWIASYWALAGNPASVIFESNLKIYIFVAAALSFVPVISAPYAITASRKQKAYLAVLLRRWRKVIIRWDQLYYCSRCDRVCNPQTGQHVPTQAMSQALYQDILNGTNTL